MNLSQVFSFFCELSAGNIMKKLFPRAVVFFVLFFLGSFPSGVFAQEVDAQQAVKLIQESIAALKDISTSIVQSHKFGEINTSFIGTLRFKAPNKFRANVEIADGLGNKLKSLSVYEGNVLWQEQTDEKSGKITVFKSIMRGTSPQAGEFLKQFNPIDQVKSLLRDYSVLSVKKEESAQGSEYILELEINPEARQRRSQEVKAFSRNTSPEDMIADRVIFCWNLKTEYVSSLKMFSENQKMQVVIRYTKAKINAGIDDEVFVYSPPKGVNIIDMSEAMAKEIVKREFDGAENELVGSVCPEFSLPNIFGEKIQSKAMRGKVVIINFWEHWCPPCKKELPLLEELFQSVFEEEVQVLTITTDEEQALRVVDENGYSFPVLIDADAGLAKQLGVHSVPRIVVLDTQGVLRAVYIGYHADIKDILTEQIDKWKKDEG